MGTLAKPEMRRTAPLDLQILAAQNRRHHIIDAQKGLEREQATKLLVSTSVKELSQLYMQWILIRSIMFKAAQKANEEGWTPGVSASRWFDFGALNPTSPPPDRISRVFLSLQSTGTGNVIPP